MEYRVGTFYRLPDGYTERGAPYWRLENTRAAATWPDATWGWLFFDWRGNPNRRIYPMKNANPPAGALLVGFIGNLAFLIVHDIHAARIKRKLQRKRSA